MSTSIETLTEIFACREAVEWVRANHSDLESAWLACPRGDWMLWYAGKKSGAPESDGRKKLVLAACECARLALPHAKSPTVLACIETAEKWARGEATIEQMMAARRAAYDAAAYAAAYADAAAAYAAAAYAAAYAAAAAAYAAYADARKQTRAKCAEIVRKHYPTLP